MRFLVFQVQLVILCFVVVTVTSADIIHLSEITTETSIVPIGNVTADGRDETGSFFRAPDVGYNTVAAVLVGDDRGPVSNGNFLNLGFDDSISIDLFTGVDVPSEGAMILRLCTGTWDGTHYSYTGNRHSHEFIPWFSDGQWHTLTQRIDSFSDPIGDLSELTNVVAYTVDAVQWENVSQPYSIGIGSAAVPEPTTSTFLILGMLLGFCIRPSQR